MQTFRQAWNLSVVQAEMMGEDPGVLTSKHYRAWTVASRRQAVMWEHAVYFEDTRHLSPEAFRRYATDLARP